MLDIISMITVFFILIGLPLILIVIGGNKNKTQMEIDQDTIDEEKFIKDYLENKKNNFVKCTKQKFALLSIVKINVKLQISKIIFC